MQRYVKLIHIYLSLFDFILLLIVKTNGYIYWYEIKHIGKGVIAVLSLAIGKFSYHVKKITTKNWTFNTSK